MEDDEPTLALGGARDAHLLDEDVKTATVVGAQHVGRYELLLRLASGGMATIYVGRQRGAGGFERVVAIKRMHAHVGEVEELAASFMDEARIASMIRHPNVVSVLDVHESQGERLLVMDFIDGVSLAEVVRAAKRRGVRIPRPASLRILVDTLNGLHAAHELCTMSGRPLGVVHRDATPHNILLGIDGSVRITDFGIAKAAERSVHTDAGLAKGKFRYMAPEQAKGGLLDRRVDVFAVGIVAWELLAGERLFGGETDAEVLLKISSGDVTPLRKVDPSVPAELEAIVMRALATDPNDRWATAEAFAHAVREWAQRAGELTTPSEVARLVTDLCGERIDQRTAALKAVLAGERPPSGAHGEADGAGTGSTAGTSAPLTVDSVKIVAAVSERDIQRRRLRRILAVAAAFMGILAIAAAVLLVIVARDRRGEPSAQSSAAAPSTAPTTSATRPPSAAPVPAAEPAVVTVRVESDAEIVAVRAPGASNITLADERATFDVPRSDEELTIRLSLADGSNLEERVTPTANTTLRVRSVSHPSRRGAPGAARPPANAPRKGPPGELEENPYE